MNELIAILEDDSDIRKLIKITLEREGYKTIEFEEGKHLLEFINSNLPELVILDLMLPDMDGLEICRKIRSNERTSHLPIIIVSAKGEELDRVLGLEVGADDYVTKPFSARELLARIKATLRRARRTESEPEKIILGPITLIPERFEVFVREQRLNLTTTEFQILLILAKNPGRVFSREEIINSLWKGEKFVLDRTIDVHIKKLRDKLGEAARLIKSIRGIGYKIEV